jgi:hypothetical protein
MRGRQLASATLRSRSGSARRSQELRARRPSRFQRPAWPPTFGPPEAVGLLLVSRLPGGCSLGWVWASWEWSRRDMRKRIPPQPGGPRSPASGPRCARSRAWPE